MTASLRTAQQQELHKKLWGMAEDLRGKIDGWEFKSYVLGMMFYRFISEDLTRYLNEQEAAADNCDFNYADLPDDQAKFGQDETVQEKGYYILPSQLFENVLKMTQNEDEIEDLNEVLDKAFRGIEDSAQGTESEEDFQGLFDELDVNASKLGGSVAERNRRLAKVMEKVSEIDTGEDFTDSDIDIFGDAYEFLMGRYASQAGKSGGEYFTPQEVSEVLTRITLVGKDKIGRVYDPAAGSASLLLKFAKFLGKDNLPEGFYGQESNPSTHALARINMFLHGIPFEKFDIAYGDTLIEPMHDELEPFEAIVSNPPFTTEWVGDDDVTLINDPRYAPAGVLAPKDHADYAFLMHILSYLADNGTAAVVVSRGVLYRRNAEAKIREYLVRHSFVDAVINLPGNIFYGTPQKTAILVLKKNRTDDKVLFVEGSHLFKKEGPRNFLLRGHQDEIVNTYEQRSERDHFSYRASLDEIEDAGFFLEVSNFVEPEEIPNATNIDELNIQLEELSEEMSELREVMDDFINEFSEYGSALSVNELVSKLNPDGVDRVPLSKLLDYQHSNKFTVSSQDYDDSFETPVLTAGKTFLLGYTDDKNGIYEASLEDPVVIFDDFTTSQKWVDFPFKVKSTAMKMLRPKEDVDVNFRYVYYAMSAIGYRPSEHKRQWISRYSSFEIPLPAIEVQDEVVRIIDAFRKITNNLREERKLREKQITYYRDKMLAFGDFDPELQEVEIED